MRYLKFGILSLQRVQEPTLIVLVLPKQHAATYVIMSAIEDLATIGLAAEVYDGNTPIIICSC